MTNFKSFMTTGDGSTPIVAADMADADIIPVVKADGSQTFAGTIAELIKRVFTSAQIVVGSGVAHASAVFASKMLFSGTYAGFSIRSTNGTPCQVTMGLENNVVRIVEDTDYANLNGTRFAYNIKTGQLALEGDETPGAYLDPPNAKAMGDIRSTTRGWLMPRMTTIQRDAISSPPEGLEIYNLTTHKKNYHDGTSWVAV